jgi:DNA-binding transcriptional ArsR family regulator
MQQRRTASERDAERTRNGDATSCGTGAPADLLDLLGDDYTRAAIDAIREEPRSGGEVAEVTGMSKPTAFRRLNDLVDLGLVEVRRRIDPQDGHHSKLYELVVDSLSFDLGDGTLDVTVRRDGTARERGVPAGRDGESAPSTVAWSG